MDTTTPEKRSRVMAAVRSKNTRPEMAVRRVLHGAGLRYRLHDARLPGKPDIVLPRHRTAVFVHGCLWHAHGCPNTRVPQSNTEYWSTKLARNAARDAEHTVALRAAGWTVAVIWECDIAAATLNLASALGVPRRKLPS